MNDEEVTPVTITDPNLAVTDESRRRTRSSNQTIDSSELLLGQLRMLGVQIPTEGALVTACKAAIKQIIYAVHKRGQRTAAIEVAKLESELAYEKERCAASNANNARLKEAILKTQRGEMSLRDLAQEVMRPTSDPPKRSEPPR